MPTERRDLNVCSAPTAAETLLREAPARNLRDAAAGTRHLQRARALIALDRPDKRARNLALTL